MKLLMLANKFPYPAKDGSSIAIMSMIDIMLHSGIEVHLLSLNTRKHFRDPKYFAEKYSQVKLNAVNIDTTITPLNTLVNLANGKPFHISRFYDEEVNNVLAEILKKNTFDIIQFEGIFMAPYLSTVRSMSKGKCVLRLHNIEHVIWERQVLAEKSPLKKWYLNLQSKRLKNYETSISLKFDAFLPISDIDGAYFNKLDSSIPQKSIACAVDLKKYKTTSKSQDFFYIGAMDWMPNIVGMQWFLKEVWPLVAQQLPQAKFYFAGRSIPSSILNIDLPGLEIIGEVESAPDFFNAHGIFIVPLLSGSGIRIKIIEAMAYGKAIVSTAVGAEGIYTTEDNMAIYDKPNEMADAMIDLYRNPNKAQQMADNARKTAEEHYSLEKLSRDIHSFFNAIS